MTTRKARGILSVGYEGRTLGELLSRLVAEKVQTLVDVRLTPISRKPGLSQTTLSAALHEAGVTYRHLPALGNPKENREPFWQGDVARGRQVFRQLLQGDQSAAALAEVAALSDQHLVALLCYERQQTRCHRQVIVDEVIRSYASLAVRELD
jgi:uncharacterized protein (DUF488 family)